MATKSRLISKLISGTGQVKAAVLDSDAIGVSTQKSLTTVSGTATYSSADTLPTTATDGDQALVTSTNRLYIYSGSGWYNIALVNNTPYWSTEASSSYNLNINGTSTTITILAVDSEGVPITYTATADSDFNQIATVTKDSDSGRTFTIIPTDSENGTAVTGTGTITFKASDGVNVVSTLSTFNLTFITTVDNSKHTTLLSKADTAGTDNQVDASTNTHTITENGNVTSTALSPYHPGGYSTYFDGSGDYIRFDNAVLAEGTGDFTAEAWVYRTGSHSTNDSIFGHDAAPGYQIAFGSSNNLRFDVGTSSGDEYLSTGTLEANRWYHIVYQRASGVLQGFKDGVSLGTQNVSTNFTNTKIDVGVNRGGTAYFEGYLRDVRIVKGTAVYSGSGFTPPTEPLTAISGTTLLTCHAPYIGDGSTNSHTITVNGNTLTKRFSPYDYLGYTKADHGGSVYFDGTDDYFAVDGGYLATNTTWWNSSGFTLETWLYKVSTSDEHTIWDNRQSGNVNGFLFRIRSGGLYLYSNNAVRAADLGEDIVNSWQHVALVCSGTTGKIFQNGVQVGSDFTIPDTASHTYFGRTQNTIGAIQYTPRGAGVEYNGYMSDFRISSGSRYTGTFTPPTEAFANDGTTVFLTFKNQNDIWEQADGKPWTKVTGGPTVSNTQRKFTTSSALNFAGTTNTYLLKDLGETIGTRDFTVEAWVYPTTTGAQHVFQISNQSAGYQSITSQNTQVGIGMNGGFWRYGTTGWNFGYVHTTTAVVVNTWHHVAYVRTGGYSKLYLNGTEIHSNADTANYSARYLAYGVGNQSNNVWYGYTQGLRVALGYARYTSNFTPPTEEFDG